MKYYLDTEFLEGKQDKSFLGIKYGETKPTIDLISIGIVAEDGREYYAISKDFNLKEAWNRFQPETTEYTKGFGHESVTETERVYWLRENVLRPIYSELFNIDLEKNKHNPYKVDSCLHVEPRYRFTYKNFKRLVKTYGKSNDQIAREISLFTGCHKEINKRLDDNGKFTIETNTIIADNVTFHAYYADYDWVVFCQLFGTMMQLPKGFPMYCIDLKQELDKFDLKSKAKQLPRQENEHNALADAIWNKRLHEFLNKL